MPRTSYFRLAKTPSKCNTRPFPFKKGVRPSNTRLLKALRFWRQQTTAFSFEMDGRILRLSMWRAILWISKRPYFRVTQCLIRSSVVGSIIQKEMTIIQKEIATRAPRPSSRATALFSALTVLTLAALYAHRTAVSPSLASFTRRKLRCCCTTSSPPWQTSPSKSPTSTSSSSTGLRLIPPQLSSVRPSPQSMAHRSSHPLPRRCTSVSIT
mmetsp:Transcript_63495/g.125583  ORF Transcript_63495/g.125583 Transcript_63495/m.125583 type:complete len:211 (-) Transcript_63495:851-1483(-)